MLTMDNDIRLSVDSFRQIRDLIYERSGIYFQDNKAYLLESRLAGRVRETGCRSFGDYLFSLRYGNDEKEFSSLFKAVTICETSFFRDMEQLDVVNNGLLNGLLEEKRREGISKLRFWSAACSSGEEPYTMAMYLLERRSLLGGLDIEILGSDINEAVLAAARKGVYGNYSVKHTPGNYLNRYFVSNGDGTYSVKPEVKQLVRFANLNLYDVQRLKLMKGMDIIFCRNVLIYFDDDSKRKVVSALYDCLNPGGYLVIGRAESLHNLTRAFRPVTVDKMFFYKKV